MHFKFVTEKKATNHLLVCHLLTTTINIKSPRNLLGYSLIDCMFLHFFSSSFFFQLLPKLLDFLGLCVCFLFCLPYPLHISQCLGMPALLQILFRITQEIYQCFSSILFPSLSHWKGEKHPYFDRNPYQITSSHLYSSVPRHALLTDSWEQNSPKSMRFSQYRKCCTVEPRLPYTRGVDYGVDMCREGRSELLEICSYCAVCYHSAIWFWRRCCHDIISSYGESSDQVISERQPVDKYCHKMIASEEFCFSLECSTRRSSNSYLE